MRIAARKKISGFTLLEVLVVFAITAILVAITVGGLTYLQNAVVLDNAIRDIKVEIQSAQNNARNSLVVRPGASTLNLSANNISIGWVVTVQNGTNAITITKRSVYFNPTNYDAAQLRTDIKSLFVNAANQNISCQNNFLFQGGTQMLLSSRTIYCSQSSDGSNDYSTMTIKGVTLQAPASGIANCTANGSGVTLSNSLFFTSGYGETIANTNTVTSCQLAITNAGALKNNRSIKINKDTGSIAICGNYCP